MSQLDFLKIFTLINVALSKTSFESIWVASCTMFLYMPILITTENLWGSKEDIYSKTFTIDNITIDVLYTVKRVDEVVRHPHLVTQDQFTQVSKKVSFRHPWRKFYYKYQTFSTKFKFVELLRYKHIPHVEICRGWPSNFSNRCSFKNVELLRHSCKVSKGASSGARTFALRFTFWHATTAPHFPT